MNKLKNKPVGKYRSKLERTAAQLLKDAGLWFRYEPWEVLLFEPYKSELDSYERIGKQFKLQSKSVRKISYTPDFVGKGWVLETKGKRTPDFNIKWKLFKKHLEENQLSYLLLMPTNKKEILQSIEIIKEYGKQ